LQLREKNCHTFPSNLSVKVPAFPPYRHPDLTALWSKAEIEQIGGIDVLVNPQLIVEVFPIRPKRLTAAINSAVTDRSKVLPNTF
jgi:hypothetical protein